MLHASCTQLSSFISPSSVSLPLKTLRDALTIGQAWPGDDPEMFSAALHVLWAFLEKIPEPHFVHSSDGRLAILGSTLHRVDAAHGLG